MNSKNHNNNLQQYATTISLDSSSFKNFLKQRKNKTPDVVRSITDTSSNNNNNNLLSKFAEHLPEKGSYDACLNKDLKVRS